MTKKQNRKQNIVPLRDLNLTDNFLFEQVMNDYQAHQDVLSIIFGKEIPLLEENAPERELQLSPLARSVRMDVYAMDKEYTVYDTEMQKQKKTDLAKRSRYYQAMIDTSLLQPGILNYQELNQTYIIIITPFDLFGYGKYQYTFEPVCKEEPECTLGDGAVRIFLNTRGTNENEVSKELVELLHYLEETTDENAESTKSERIKRIHGRVQKVKTSEEAGVRYLRELEEKNEAREEGHEEGLLEGLSRGRAEGLSEGLSRGVRENKKSVVRKKLAKGKTAEEIADALEESIEEILSLVEELKEEQDRA